MSFGVQVITRVLGLEQYYLDVDLIAKIWQKQWAASTTVDEGTQKLKGREICVQGPFASNIAQFLVSEYMLPSSVVSVI